MTRVSYTSGLMQGVAGALRDMAVDLELDGMADGVAGEVIERLRRSADILERNGSETFALVEEYIKEQG